MSLPYLQPYLGLSNGVNTLHGGPPPGGWDYEDDYSSYASQAAADAVWEKNVTNVQVDIVNDNLKFSSDNVSANWSVANNLANRGYLPSKLSDTAWVNRHIVNFTTVQASDGCGVSWCNWGMSSVGKTNSGSGGVFEDWLGWFIYENDFYTGKVDNQYQNTSSGSTMTTSLTTGLKYMEMIRLSATSFKCEAFSDSGFSSSLYSATITIPSTIVNLQYATWRKWADTGVCGANPTVGTIDNFQISNGVTVAP